jgi:hypothetical protein
MPGPRAELVIAQIALAGDQAECARLDSRSSSGSSSRSSSSFVCAQAQIDVRAKSIRAAMADTAEGFDHHAPP